MLVTNVTPVIKVCSRLDPGELSVTEIHTPLRQEALQTRFVGLTNAI